MANSTTQTGSVVGPGTRSGLFGARAFPWLSVGRRIIAWRLRSRSRDDLLTLSDEVLQDIGVTRPRTSLNVVKPIWMP
jgi:uncharacterized protein YjiS (DUF1127 family)